MGFIYLLYNDAGYGYIGQTSRRTMNQRIKDHKKKENKCRSKILGEFEWLVLEEVANEDLLDFESYYYDIYNEMFPNMLVNRCVPLRTKKEGQRLYYEVNKEGISNKKRIYHKANKGKLAEYKERRNELQRIRRAKAKNNLTPV